ncbi:MAG: cupin domain-containing protein [Thermoanaerobaculia bacterium]|nr:cupin domain-containing protein [Thermoanaerobaculia bacterium]
MKTLFSHAIAAFVILTVTSASSEAQAEVPVTPESQLVELPRGIDPGEPREVSVLLDEDHLKLVTITLRGGAELAAHSAPAATTIQVLQGRGVVHVGGQARDVSEGTIITLPAGLEHDVVPAPESDMLLLVHYLRCAPTSASQDD